jgi:uncharacterized membrane protein YidH (DUF202 family)
MLEIPKIQDIREGLKREKSEITPRLREQIFTLIGGAFGLVAALAWNDAVQTLFREIFPVQAHSVIAKFAYAAVVTVIAVYFLIKVEKIFRKTEKKDAD